MFRDRYDQLAKLYGYRSTPTSNQSIMAAFGPKRIIGQVVFAHHNKITVRYNDDASVKTIEKHYSLFTELDANGNAIPDIVKDITGRVIQLQSWIAYSIHAGSNSHGLSIGQVIEITRTGVLKVATPVSSERESRYTNIKSVNDPERTLLIPFDAGDFALYRLTDFEKINE